ncbi:unnamed protein product [Acanthoscelides obtectus]|uniref:Uncharacterized protein n=1 Tax=Acanthoscelides obtectus TaxID=200917 RepID=A0A9P0PFZ4_ACAOB|nr:unnamed protein product [Acanthoscelides obtectus]CAK1631951.1 Modular serine protease [Acanthoscelides obtectus]
MYVSNLILTKLRNVLGRINSAEGQISRINQLSLNITRVKRQTTVCDGFKCNSGECIPKNQVCNGMRNCKDADDEGGCEGTSVFKCGSGEFINEQSNCDGTVDCRDGSDETDSCKDNVICPGYVFTCAYGACIDKYKVCNRNQDCRDNSDEANCTKVISNSFKCKSGEIIDEDLHCNGHEDCSDGSDETNACKKDKLCPGYVFTCSYGACIDSFKRCDGNRDCKDGSDEIGCDEIHTTSTRLPPSSVSTITTTKSTLSSIGKNCLLPENPEHGKWISIALQKELPSLTWVDTSSLFRVKCDAGYQPSNPFLICDISGWVPVTPPKCEKLCPPIKSNYAMHLECKNKNGTRISCSQATSGSTLEYSCEAFYHSADKYDKRRVCIDGKWNWPLPECIPDCGRERVPGAPLIVHGNDTQKGSYPWATIIFIKEGNTMKFICGGSMISTRFILTAAHCVTTEDGNLFDSNLFEVAVGKYFSNYSITETSAQLLKIQKCIVHKEYRGDKRGYQADIALMKTTKNILLTLFVQPVCITNLCEVSVHGEGLVTGWGATQPRGRPADSLKVATYPIKDRSECLNELPKNFTDYYLTADKICAGYYEKDISVCKGDSGGGLVFSNTNDSDRYYITGIVSLGHRLKFGCNTNQAALFTNVKYYYDWISCILIYQMDSDLYDARCDYSYPCVPFL